MNYSFSNAGRLSALTDWGSRTSSYTYTPAGLAATVTLPNGMVTTYTYDRAQRLTNLTNVLSGVTITSHAYTLDSEGNRTALSEVVSGITTGTSDSFGMTYDGLERLTGVTTTNPESFTLDGASNITARTGPAATYTIDGANRPTSDGTNTLTWSAADRLTGRGSDTFGFDPLDRLTSSTVSGAARSYAYDADGLLGSRTEGASTTRFAWDPTTSPQRLLVSGSDFIVYGLGPLYRVNGTTVTAYARDGQKSIRAELNGSTITGSWRYLAYGAIAQSSGAATPSILGYGGQLLDPSGLLYMRARWYDATSGRFLTRDPIELKTAAANRFVYASANPLTWSDPSGLLRERDEADLAMIYPPDESGTILGTPDDNPDLRRGEGGGPSTGTGGGSSRFAPRESYAAERQGVLDRVVEPGGAMRMYAAPTRQLAPGGEREYIPTLAIREAIGVGMRLPDPQGTPGYFMYQVEVAYGSRSAKVLEVLVDEQEGVIAHVLMRRIPGRY